MQALINMACYKKRYYMTPILKEYILLFTSITAFLYSVKRSSDDRNADVLRRV